MVKNCRNYSYGCRNYVTLHGQTKQLQNDNEQMENQLKELKIAMGQEKAQREYGRYLLHKNQNVKNTVMDTNTEYKVAGNCLYLDFRIIISKILTFV